MAQLSLNEGLGLVQQRAKLARIGIYIFMAGFALVALCEIARLAGILDLETPGPLLLPAVAIYLGSIAAYLLSALFVGMWIYRAHANLFAAGLDGLVYSPGWAVGWFFIPIANLFKPFQAMRELWTASHAEPDGFAAPAPHELAVWWGTFIVGNMFMNISSRFEEGAAGAQQTAAALNLVGIAIMIACAGFLMRIIDRVTAAQQSVVVGEAFA